MTLRKEAVVVFGYAFAHQKTQDFLLELSFAGFRQVVVLAAPWRPLAQADPRGYFPTGLSHAAPTDPQTVCKSLGFECHIVAHDDVAALSALRNRPGMLGRGFGLGLIAGARLIKSAVIDMFEEGILNIHPGLIPQTSGLDGFYHTIKNRVPLGATAHYIDRCTDAGEVLFFEETPIGPDDTPDTVLHNHYQSQIRALRRFVVLRDAGALVRTPANRLRKNAPMLPDEKRAMIAEFPVWRTLQVRSQAARAVIAACESGQLAQIGHHLDRFPDLLDHRTPQGWTPLIVAAFHGQTEVLMALLGLGANPNVCGINGTTPLMYAKTAFVAGRSTDMAGLDALLAAGADPYRRDCLGKDVFDYLSKTPDTDAIKCVRHRLAGGKP